MKMGRGILVQVFGVQVFGVLVFGYSGKVEMLRKGSDSEGNV